jgi:cytochrome c oxidase assembly factor CtaG
VRASTAARAAGALRPLARPLWCLVFFWAVVLVTHVPWFFDRAATHPPLLAVEHVLYLLGGLVMWWPIHDPDPPHDHRLDGFSRLGYVVVAMVPMELIGAFLNRDPTLLYAAYARPAHLLGISAITDQQVSGGIMWVFGSSLMAATGLWQAMAALNDEEQRLRSVEQLLDARSKDGTGRA